MHQMMTQIQSAHSSKDDPVCPSSGCPKRDLAKQVNEDPVPRMGNYSAEGSWELKNATDTPLGPEWNSKGAVAGTGPHSTNATSLAHHGNILAQISNSSIGAAGCGVHHNGDYCNYTYSSGIPKMTWDRVSIQAPEYVPPTSSTPAADGTAPISLAQLSNATDPVATAAGSGCSKHHNNDANCLYKGPNTGIKMVYDNVVTPAPSAPANETRADGTSGGTLV